MSGYFVPSGQPRARRASDVAALVVGIVVTLWAWSHVERISSIESAITDLIGSFPSWFDSLYDIGYGLAVVYVVVLIIAVIVGGSERREVLRDIVVALALAFALSAVLAAIAGNGLSDFRAELPGVDPEPVFPVLRVALVTAVIVASAPSVTRPMRRLGWLILGIATVSAIGLGYGFASDVIGGIAVGVVAASAVLLVFGSPKGYPALEAVVDGLADLGLEVRSLDVRPEQSWGVRTYSGVTDTGAHIDVTAYGRDATDSQWLARLWHTLWYRDRSRAFATTRREGVEHEALMTMLAARDGVTVESVLAVGVTGADDLALLATSSTGVVVELADVSADSAASMWREVGAMHRIGMAHGDLRVRSFRTDDGGAIVVDLSAASVDADPAALHLDTTSLLFELSTVLGPEEAVRIAAASIGDEAVGNALPFVQVPALSRSQRRDFPKPKPALADLRTAIIEVTGVDEPEPAKLRRVKPTDLVTPALSLVAAYALIGLLGDIDFEAVWEVVQDATWPWIIVGFLVGQFVFLPEATAMYYAVGFPLPLRPLTVLQISVKWIGLAVPSAAGRVTMNTVFLRKYGVSPTIALTQGAIDGLSGFVVEALILLVALFAYEEFDLDLDTPELNWGLILLVVGLIAVITVTAVFRIQRLRALVVPPLKEGGRVVWDVLRTPKRAFGLVGSNLVSRTVLAIVLWFVLQAIGTPLPLVTCLVVTVATNLLAGLVPIPGGIGVAEAVMTSFLVVFGLNAEAAFAAAVVYRVATFYIPAIEGLPAMQWLERNGYI